jgi:hypothetical protein
LAIPIIRLFRFMGAMDTGTATWVMAVAVITMVGAEAAITVGDRTGRTKPREAALIGGLFSPHNPRTCIARLAPIALRPALSSAIVKAIRIK